MHVVGMIIGMAICYIFGTAWLAGQLGMSFVAALGVGVIPYLPGDTAKIIITIIAGPQIRKGGFQIYVSWTTLIRYFIKTYTS